MSQTDPRTVQFVRLSDVTPDPRNPKSHHLETIDQSIGRFGMVDGIVRDDRTGYIISGHGRRKALEAMRDRGETPPEGVKVDPDGEWLVPILTGWASRTDSEAAAALIAMNRTTELGGWVDDELLSMLEDLSTVEDGFKGVGFGADDISDLERKLASLAAVDGWNAAAEEEGASSGMAGDDEADDEDLIGSVTVTGDTKEIVVVIPPERYEEFYKMMAGLDWIIDVRDRLT